MPDRNFKPTTSRHQTALFPLTMEDFVSQNNPVRAIDGYVNCLDLFTYGFQYTDNRYSAGQPAYSPAALLKMYLYGYLKRIRSSRLLEAESGRNTELMWLTENLRPGYKTIANFRKDNHKALCKVNKDFVLLCKEWDLFSGELVAIDGSLFRANASMKSIQSQKGLKKLQQKIEEDIQKYLDQLDEQDKQASPNTTETAESLQEKMTCLKNRLADTKKALAELVEQNESHRSLTDADARMMSKGGKSSVNYNVQQTVDDKHQLIVDHKVTNQTDMGELADMAIRAKEIMDADQLIAVADKGYFKGSDIKDCVDQQVTPYVPSANHSAWVTKEGRYTAAEFRYQKEEDYYLCPAGQQLTPTQQTHEKSDRQLQRYKSDKNICKNCDKAKKCLPKKTPYRQIDRWIHEDIMDEHKARMDADGAEMMVKRKSLVEHPFGTLKSRLGGDNLLMRGMDKVKGEVSLMMLMYNMTRVINIIGLKKFRDHCAQMTRIDQEYAENMAKS